MSQIAVFEPYYGGSHRVFLDELTKLPHAFRIYTLPANRWKWRMRLAAPHWSGLIRQGQIDLYGVEKIVCSSFLDLATFKGMLPLACQQVPILVYFHENQFAYPVQVNDPRDVHFALTNLTTALTAESLAFNSMYNLESFLAGCHELLAKNNDMELAGYQDAIRRKSRILHPGIDFSAIDRHVVSREADSRVPVVVWNHRWEHDKDPEFFFRTLYALQAEGVSFRLIVLGESFRQSPKIFIEAQKLLADRIIHFGHVQSRAEYLAWLVRADIVVSTARHEFFGLSVMEAVRAGCRPLLPRRLVYPELFPDTFLYDDRELGVRLRSFLKKGRLTRQQACELTERFSWTSVRPRYEEWLTG